MEEMEGALVGIWLEGGLQLEGHPYPEGCYKPEGYFYPEGKKEIGNFLVKIFPITDFIGKMTMNKLHMYALNLLPFQLKF